MRVVSFRVDQEAIPAKVLGTKYPEEWGGQTITKVS